MKPGRRFLAVSAIAAIVLAFFGLSAPTNETGSVSTSAGSIVLAQYPPQIPGIPCAKSGGPAKSYASANKTTERKCWWGKEVLFSKNDSKLIIAGAQGGAGLIGLATKKILPPKVAQGIVVAAVGGGPITIEAAGQAIEKGRCLKLVWAAHVVPGTGSYNCT